jgi:hypothetical protein
MHTRYFLQSAEVIRQVHVAKDLIGVTTSRQQLDEVGQAARATVLPGQRQHFVAHHWRASGVHINCGRAEPLPRVTRSYKLSPMRGSGTRGPEDRRPRELWT